MSNLEVPASTESSPTEQSWRERLDGATKDTRSGAKYLVSALKFLRQHPQHLKYVAAPIIINLMLSIGAVIAAFTYGPRLWNALFDQPAGWFGVIWQAGAIMSAVLMFFCLLLVVYLASGLLALPFNELLSESVERIELGDNGEESTWKQVAGDIGLSVAHSILGVTLWLVVMIPIFMLNLIPAVGSFAAAILAWLATALFLARELMDSPLSRRRMGFAHKVKLAWGHRETLLGLGGVAAMMLWVPMLNFLMMPVAVTAGTLFYCDLVRAGTLESLE